MPEQARQPAARRLLFGAVTALSGAAYLRWSQELRHELADPGYKRALVQQFFHEHGWAAVRLLHPVSTAGALTVAVFAAACAAAGIVVRRGLGGARSSMETTVFACAAAVLPALLLATIGWPDGRGMLTSATLAGGSCVVGIVALVVALRRRRATTPVVPPPALAEEKLVIPSRDEGQGWALVLLAALVPLLLVVWWNGVDAIRGFDSLADHLPRAARWLRLARLSDESGTLLTPYYPGDFQLFVRWILVLGTDAYAFVPSLAGAVLSLAALFGICRALGQPRWTAAVATAAAASCSLVPYLATTVEADTATTAFLLVAVLVLVRWLRDTSPARAGQANDITGNLAALAALGASLGLAIGTKYSALPPALAVSGVAAVSALHRSLERLPNGRRIVNARTFVMLVSAVAVPLVLCGAYWYVRNAVAHGNPFYPVATAGLPGVDMRYIIPVKPALSASGWARATYPWVQWDYVTVYDDGLGPAFASVALPAFLAMAFGRPRPGSPRRLVWGLTAAGYLLWIGTGSITARFGLFPLLLTFAFVGEAWREFESVVLKLVTVSSVLLGIAVTTGSLLVGAVYTSVMPPGYRGVPAVVDSLPPSRIFNATTAANRYALLGRDYRHEVVTMFGPARPADLDSSGARYVLLGSAQVPAFSPGARLVARGPAVAGMDTLSLWERPLARSSKR